MGRIDPSKVEHVGILGAGTIGASWAAYFLSRGLRVTASDPAPDFEHYARAYIANAWPDLARLGMGAEADPERITFESDPDAAMRDVQFIQESVPERLDLKRAVYRQIEDAVAPEVIIASSSSGLLATELQADCRAPERLVVAHPFNPPHLIPMVEIVGGRKTDLGAVDWALDFFQAWGKQPIRLNKEVPGHVANRLQAALWREAVNLVDRGVASVADVDRAIAYGPGLRWAIMGPHMTFRLGAGGHGFEAFVERYRPSFETWWADLGRRDDDLAAERDAALVGIREVLDQVRAGR